MVGPLFRKGIDVDHPSILLDDICGPQRETGDNHAPDCQQKIRDGHHFLHRQLYFIILTFTIQMLMFLGTYLQPSAEK